MGIYNKLFIEQEVKIKKFGINFLNEINQKNLTIQLWAIPVFTIVYLLWLIFDYILEPKFFSYLFNIRLTCTLLNILIFIFTFKYSKKANLKFSIIYLITFIFFIFYCCYNFTYVYKTTRGIFILFDWLYFTYYGIWNFIL